MADKTETHAHVSVWGALNEQEIEFLSGFGRRDPFDHHGDAGRPCDRVRRIWRGQPAAWSPWVPCLEGCCLMLDDRGPSAHAAVWLRFLIREFLRPGAAASHLADGPAGFSFDHRLDGRVSVRGKGLVDVRTLTVANNRVSERSVVLRQDDETWTPARTPRGSSPALRRRRGIVVNLDVRRRRGSGGK